MNFEAFDRQALQLIAKAVNPALTVLLLSVLAWRWCLAGTSPWPFLARVALALLAAFVLGRINEKLHIWPGLPTDRKPYEFPSGHTCYAASVATSLVLFHHRFLLLVVPVLAAYGALIVLPPLRYHNWLDVLGAWLLVPPLTLLCHRLGRKLKDENAPKVSP